MQNANIRALRTSYIDLTWI